MTRERTLRGQGRRRRDRRDQRTTSTARRRSPSSRSRCRRSSRACADAGHRSARDRRLRLLQQRPQRPVAPGRRARPAASCASPTCSGAAAAAAARRRWATRRRRWRRAGRLRRGVPRARPGPVPALRRGAAGAHACRARRRSPFPYGLMSPAQRFAMRVMRFMHEHGIAPGGAARHRARLVPSRAGQPARGHARPAAHRRGLRRLALDRRALPPLRLLPWRTTAPPR